MVSLEGCPVFPIPAIVLPSFGRSVNPISTGGHIIPTSLLRALPDIQTLRRHCVVCSQTRTVPRFESELRSINIEDDMNKHLHNTYIVANLLLYVLEYEQVYKDETKIIRLNEKALTYYLVNQSST